jgi:predicted dehydrogenase
MPSNRRNFIRQITAGAGVLTFPISAAAAGVSNTNTSPNESLNVALIGCNGMGWANLRSMLKNEGVECVAICDVDQTVLSKRVAELEKSKLRKPILYTDYRKLLANKDIDAVIIGTPDHWHCLQMIHACEAGKDVYVEKPIANSIEECNRMVAATKRYDRVVQVGQWQRSDPHWIAALEYLQSGQLGKIRTARTWACVSYGRNFQPKPDAPVPAEVDYDMWLGPAPKRPFNPYRFHGTFRYFWDYAGGLMTDWGVHMIDMVLGGMNVSVPESVHAAGGKIGFPGSAIETPDTLQAVYQFKDFTMLWEQSLGTGRAPYNRAISQPGVSFTGNNGTLVIDRETWEVYPETEEGKYLLEAMPVRQSHENGIDAHTKNFVECVKSRRQPNCTIEMGRNAAVTAQLGNISYRVGRQLVWDDEKSQIADNEQANQLVKARYREPWVLPKV